MFGSQPPSRPRKRHKRHSKPAWTDPETRVTDATATRFTLGPNAEKLIPYADMFRALSLIDWYYGRRPGGTKKARKS